jgi:hypothetical protein
VFISLPAASEAVPLFEPTESISSIKITQGAFFFASVNTFLILEEPIPTN